jgi:hypothetical protein
VSFDFMHQPGPCVICGDTNYSLSCGGSTICPKCDCGNFDAATVQKQAKVIAQLRFELSAERERCAKIAISFGEFPGSKLIKDMRVMCGNAIADKIREASTLPPANQPSAEAIENKGGSQS